MRRRPGNNRARAIHGGRARRDQAKSILLHMKRTIFFFATALLGALLGFSLAGYGQRPGGGEGGGRGEVKPAATIASVTQNLKKFEGFYNFYYDEKTGKIYLEVDRWGQ